MHTLPPGKYYIGDPCYVFADGTWDALLIEVDDFEDGEIKTFNDRDLWAHGTAWGDGTYTDQNGIEYGVDSGTLGIVPIELVDDPEGLEHGTVIEFQHPITVEYDRGTFWFGNIVIKTDEQEDFDDPYSGDPEDDEFA